MILPCLQLRLLDLQSSRRQPAKLRNPHSPGDATTARRRMWPEQEGKPQEMSGLVPKNPWHSFSSTLSKRSTDLLAAKPLSLKPYTKQPSTRCKQGKNSAAPSRHGDQLRGTTFGREAEELRPLAVSRKRGVPSHLPCALKSNLYLPRDAALRSNETHTSSFFGLLAEATDCEDGLQPCLLRRSCKAFRC